MKTANAKIVWPGKATLGEGPFWDELEQQLYWVDIDGYKLHIFNPDTEENTSLPFAQHVTAVVKKGKWWFIACDEGRPVFLLP